MKRAVTVNLCLALAATLAYGVSKPRPRFDASLPVLGTKFHSLPAGRGKALVEASCLPCHSADMLVQQRLTEKQWATGVDKMIRWGAVVKDEDKASIVTYLARHFGTENRFTPIRTRPSGY